MAPDENRQRNTATRIFRASELAYGAVVYLRVENAGHPVNVNLIASKTRVAPIRTVSIPRLELCAAELLSRMVHRVLNASRLKPHRIFLWSDSTVVLHWLKRSPCELKTFVANRVANIQEKTSDMKWRHISTLDNPADLLSRGVSPAELTDNIKWWIGPVWLVKDYNYWPDSPTPLSQQMNKEMSNEERPVVSLTTANTIPMTSDESVYNVKEDLLSRTNSFHHLMRITGWMIRIIRNYCHKEWRCQPLSRAEYHSAVRLWVKHAQQDQFEEEIKIIHRQKSLPANNRLAKLTPFIDECGILRVGGRLQQAYIPYEQQHQIILPPGRLAELLIADAHSDTMHGGMQQVVCYIRQRFWIPRLRQFARKIVYNCVTCARHRGIVAQQMMANLPADRVRPYKAFLHTGVDYAGPFLIHPRAGRCKIVEKG